MKQPNMRNVLFSVLFLSWAKSSAQQSVNEVVTDVINTIRGKQTMDDSVFTNYNSLKAEGQGAFYVIIDIVTD